MFCGFRLDQHAWATAAASNLAHWELDAILPPNHPSMILLLSTSQSLDWAKIWWMGKERWVAAKYLAFCGATACKAVSAGAAGGSFAVQPAGCPGMQHGCAAAAEPASQQGWQLEWCVASDWLSPVLLPQTDAATCQSCLAAKSLLKRTPELSSNDYAASEGACLAW